MKHLLTWSAGLCAALLLLLSPAHAGGMLTWGVNGGGAPAMLSFSTKGLAFLLIFIVEAIVFRRVLDITWGKAIFGSLILNAWSSVWGIFLALVAFSHVVATWVFLGAYALLTIRIFFVRAEIPFRFASILLGTLIVGTVFVYQTAGIIPPQSPLIVYFLMAVPLLIGFGISIMFETLISSRVLGGPESWKGVLAANIASYILLALMVPLYSDNIYDGREDYIEDALVQKINEGAEISEITGILEDYAATNPHLLGLTDDSTPEKDYWAGTERGLLIEAYSVENDSWSRPDYGVAIVEQVLSYPSLRESSQEEFDWLEVYFTQWEYAAVSIEENNQSEFTTASDAWERWYQTGDVPEYLEDLPEPSAIIEYLGDTGESDRDGSSGRGSGGK